MKPDTINLITDELARARKKFPHSKSNFVALVEEVGELAKDLLEGKETYKNEAVQVAAMAIRVLEEGDSDFQITISKGLTFHSE